MQSATSSTVDKSTPKHAHTSHWLEKEKGREWRGQSKTYLFALWIWSLSETKLFHTSNIKYLYHESIFLDFFCSLSRMKCVWYHRILACLLFCIYIYIFAVRKLCWQCSMLDTSLSTINSASIGFRRCTQTPFLLDTSILKSHIK